jgi:hypothetical protein
MECETRYVHTREVISVNKQIYDVFTIEILFLRFLWFSSTLGVVLFTYLNF